MSQRDGGPAFPTVAKIEGGYIGMSLRDYFAGMALQGLLAQGAHYEKSETTEGSALTLSTWAYQYADAILRQRDATP